MRWHLEHTLSTERVLARLEAVEGQVAPEMPEQIARWRYPGSLREWKENTDALEAFVARRPAVLRQMLQDLSL